MELAEQVAAALRVDDVEELAGGHQSRVFRVVGRNGLPAVAKVLESSMVDRTELDARLDVIVALADLDPRVCRPLLLGEQRVAELASPDGLECYIVCFEFAAGREPNPARASDARHMGAALSQLHVSMSQLPAAPLPVVTALRIMPDGSAPAAGAHQLLHGDFNASNLRVMSGAVRIFDLDDCGYGPRAFDVANALYMVLFDASIHGALKAYKTFRRCFVDGYAAASGSSLAEASLDRFIDLRVRALGSWLDDLGSAPTGIRTASTGWQATLRSFVADYRPTTH